MTDFFPWEQHTIFGAGLIGSYIGGALSVQGFQTTLICRATTKFKLTSGLTLTDHQSHQCVLLDMDVLDDKQLSSPNTQVKKARFLWLTVKCTGIKQAVLDIAPLVDENTIILCCQNGLGSDAEVKQAYPDNMVLRVMVPSKILSISEKCQILNHILDFTSVETLEKADFNRMKRVLTSLPFLMHAFFSSINQTTGPIDRHNINTSLQIEDQPSVHRLLTFPLKQIQIQKQIVRLNFSFLYV